MFKKFLVIAITIFTLTGCTPTDNSNQSTTTTAVTETSVIVEQSEHTPESVSEPSNTTPSTVTPSTVKDYTNFDNLVNDFSIKSCISWSEDYGAYTEVNNNKPLFTNYTTEVFENYSNLDSLGRCGVAYANVCVELQPTEERGSIGMIKPSGWKTSNYNEYPGLVDGNYLYNRCHLIGFQLAGENANEKNLITGTRYLNVTGMLPFENMVDDYLENNPKNHVLYRVTPSYIGNDLVAQGVLMEAYSVEDNGKLQFCVWCYNVQPKIYIDYATGDNHIKETKDAEYTPNINDNSDSESTNETYILNTKSKKIHLSTCKAVADMKEENKESSTKSLTELESEGYTPCGICKPNK